MARSTVNKETSLIAISSVLVVTAILLGTTYLPQSQLFGQLMPIMPWMINQPSAPVQFSNPAPTAPTTFAPPTIDRLPATCMQERGGPWGSIGLFTCIDGDEGPCTSGNPVANSTVYAGDRVRLNYSWTFFRKVPSNMEVSPSTQQTLYPHTYPENYDFGGYSELALFEPGLKTFTLIPESNPECAVSFPVTVVVMKLALAAPAKTPSLMGQVPLKVDASGPVVRVEYYYQNMSSPDALPVLIATVSSPAENPWNSMWDTSSVENGPYAVYAKAFDNENHVVTSNQFFGRVGNITIAVTAPSPNATIDGAIVLQSSVTGPVNGVLYYLINDPSGPLTEPILVAKGQAPTWDASWDTVLRFSLPPLPNGPYVLQARAVNEANQMVVSEPVPFTVNNLSATFTSPTTDTALSGNIPLSVSVTGPVAMVRFYSQAALAPGTFPNRVLISMGQQDTDTSWSAVTAWDTTQVPNNIYTLQAEVFDAAGHNALSAPLTIKVANPTAANTSAITITSPADGTTISGIVRIESFVNGGQVGGVQYSTTANKKDGSAMNFPVVSQSPFTVNWNTMDVPNGTYRIRAEHWNELQIGGTDTSIFVTVYNAPPPPPPTTTTITKVRITSINGLSAVSPMAVSTIPMTVKAQIPLVSPTTGSPLASVQFCYSGGGGSKCVPGTVASLSQAIMSPPRLSTSQILKVTARFFDGTTLLAVNPISFMTRLR